MYKLNKTKDMPPTLDEWIEWVRNLPADGGKEKKFDSSEKKVGGQSQASATCPRPVVTKASLEAARSVLIRIAEAGEWCDVGGGETRVPLPGVEVELVVGEDGRIEAQYSSPLVKALIGVDASRIKRCAVCEKIFGAERETQRACAGKCQGTFRGRLWRARRHKEKGGEDFDKILKGNFRKTGSVKKSDPNLPKRKKGARPTSGTGKASGQGMKMLDREWWREKMKK